MITQLMQCESSDPQTRKNNIVVLLNFVAKTSVDTLIIDDKQIFDLVEKDHKSGLYSPNIEHIKYNGSETTIIDSVECADFEELLDAVDAIFSEHSQDEEYSILWDEDGSLLLNTIDAIKQHVPAEAQKDRYDYYSHGMFSPYTMYVVTGLPL